MTYTPKTFNIPVLKGISEKAIKVHLGLYEGYVKNVNLIMETLAGYAAYGDKASEGDKLAIAELRRRFAFEFDGMRMHEYYFPQFEGQKNGLPAQAGNPESALAKAAAEKYGSGENFLKHIREVSTTRGNGWTVVYYDTSGKTLHTVFVTNHELGQLAGLPIILAFYLWEHAYMVDYLPAEKKNYIDALFENCNWAIVEKRFDDAMKISAA
jgi:Fe-Mn family superoxide dismutase